MIEFFPVFVFVDQIIMHFINKHVSGTHYKIVGLLALRVSDEIQP